MSSIKERISTGVNKISSLSRKKKILISLFIVALFIGGSFTAITLLFKQNPSYYSPEVDFHVDFINNTSSSYATYSPMDQFYHVQSPFNTYNMSNITVNVYATMPSFAALGSMSIAVNGSPTNNSIYVQLFNSTLADSHGNIHGTLSKVFHTIIREYRQLYTKPQEKTISISMTLQADYQFVYRNNLYVYTYYNNLPFNPWQSQFGNKVFKPYSFTSGIFFNMNSKPIVIPINNSTNSASHLHKLRIIGGGGGGSAIRCNNVVQKEVYAWWGPMPILYGDIPLSSFSEFSMAYSSIQGSFQVNLMGNQETYTTGGWQTQTSSSGAWSDSSANFVTSAKSSQTSVSAFPIYLSNLSMIGYGHFHMQLVVTKTTYEYVDGSYCAYAGSSTSAVITLLNGNNGSFDLEAGNVVNLFNVPSQYATEFVNLDWNAFFNAGLVSDKSFTVNAGSDNLTSSFAFYAKGYQTMAQQKVNNLNQQAMVLGGVSLALGILGTVAALVAAPEDGVVPSLIAITFTVGGIETGLASLGQGLKASWLQSQGTPMYISDSEISVDTMSFTNVALPNQNSGMSINLYESAQPESMIISGQSYSFNIQSPYVFADT